MKRKKNSMEKNTNYSTNFKSRHLIMAFLHEEVGSPHSAKIPQGTIWKFRRAKWAESPGLNSPPVLRMALHRKVSKCFLEGQDRSPSADALSVAFLYACSF